MLVGMGKSRNNSVWQMRPSGNLDPNPTTFVTRSTSFAGSVKTIGDATLLVVRNDAGQSGYLVAPTTSGDKAAINLAQTVAANAVEVDGELPDLTETEVIGQMEFVNDTAAMRETQQGIDPGEAARRLQVAMSDGDWVAVSVRPANRKEGKRHSLWLRGRLQSQAPVHHSTSTGAVVMSVTVGGQTREDVHQLMNAVAAAMPGFDLSTKTRIPMPRWAVTALFVLAAMTSLGASFVEQVTSLIGAPILWGAAGLALAGAAAAWKRLIFRGPMSASDLASLTFPSPARRATSPKKPQKVKKDDEVIQTDGDYPLHPRSFMVGAQVVAGVVAPIAGMSGENTTKTRATSAALMRDIGPIIGESAFEKRKVRCSFSDMLFGVAVLGQPGTGKSVLVRTLFAATLLEKISPSGKPGYPGRESTIIAFESKGADGAAFYQSWSKALGTRVAMVEVSDPATPAIDLFAVPGTVKDRASFFVNAMKYAFSDGSIQDRSFTSLLAVFTAALAVDDRIAGAVDEVRTGMSPVHYAYILLGGLGDSTGVALAGEIMSEAQRLVATGKEDADLSLAREALRPLYEGKSESARRNLTEAAANKVQQIAIAESWWTPGRRKKSWADLITMHATVVINTGTTTSGIDPAEDTLSEQMSGLLMYGLRHAIMRNCAGWNAMGKSISIFADELSLLAGSSPEVITWFREQGRSFGVRPVLATQRPEQLDRSVRQSLMGFGTLIAFAQGDADVALDIAKNLSADGSEWTSADVVNLARYSVILRAMVDQQRISPTTILLLNAEADMSTFAADQGYAE